MTAKCLYFVQEFWVVPRILFVPEITLGLYFFTEVNNGGKNLKFEKSA